MATTQGMRMKIVDHLDPAIFNSGDNVEEFIVDSKRYFEMCGLDENSQELMIKCLIARDILPVYEAVSEKGQMFEK